MGVAGLYAGASGTALVYLAADVTPAMIRACRTGIRTWPHNSPWQGTSGAG